MSDTGTTAGLRWAGKNPDVLRWGTRLCKNPSFSDFQMLNRVEILSHFILHKTKQVGRRRRGYLLVLVTFFFSPNTSLTDIF